MKYIKTFEELYVGRPQMSSEEEITLKYNVGDYVILDVDKIKNDNDDYELKNNGWRPKDPIDDIVKIIRFRNVQHEQHYDIEFYNGQDDDFYLIQDNNILREATTEEIEDFNERRKMDKKLNKFNI